MASNGLKIDKDERTRIRNIINEDVLIYNLALICQT